MSPPAAAGARAGSGGGATGCGGGAALRGSGPVLERFPNTPFSAQSGLAAPELLDERGEQARPRALHLRAAGQRLRERAEGLGGAMPGGNLGDHLPVVRRRAEQLRLERNGGDRIEFQRLGEIRRLDLGALRHSDLVEAILRTVVVR